MFTATIRVNGRGTLTLPKELRSKIGITNGGYVMAEEAATGIVLRPAVSFPIEVYSADRVAEFDQADQELGRLLKKKGKMS